VEQKSPPHLQSKPVRPSFFLQTPHFAFLAFLGFEMVVFEMVVFEMVVFDASSLAIFGCGEVSNTEFSISGVGSGVFFFGGWRFNFFLFWDYQVGVVGDRLFSSHLFF